MARGGFCILGFRNGTWKTSPTLDGKVSGRIARDIHLRNFVSSISKIYCKYEWMSRKKQKNNNQNSFNDKIPHLYLRIRNVYIA